MTKRFLLSLLLWFTICLATAAAPSFDVSVSSHQIQEQETLSLILTFKQEADPYGSMISVSEIVVPPLVDFEIVGRQTATSTVSVAGKMQMSTQTVYQLQPLRLGQLQIPVLSVPYQEGGQAKEIYSTPIVIEVGGAAQSTPQASPLPDAVFDRGTFVNVIETETASPPRQGIMYAAIALVIGSCLFLLIYLVLFLRRRRPLKNLQNQPIRLPATENRSNPTAKQIRTELPESSEVDIESLYQKVRQELESRRLLPYPGASTEEMIVFLQDHKLPASEIEAVIQFLKKTQSLRFQAIPPSPSDLKDLLYLAKIFMGSH